MPAFALAIVATAVTLEARALLAPQLHGQPAVVIFILPILLSAYFGRLSGGLLATALFAIAANYSFVAPFNGFALAQGSAIWQMVFVLVSGVGISLLTETLHRTYGRALEIEAALQQSEGRYRALVDWSPDAVAVHRNGRLIFVNPACIRLLAGTSHEELIGRTILDFVPPEFHAVTLDRMKASVEHGMPSPMMQIHLVALDGVHRDVEIQGTPIIYDGEPALLASVRDVTEHRAYEVELERLNRLYTALSHVNQAIVRLPERDDLFLSVCRILVEHGRVQTAWIGWHDPATCALVPASVWGDDGGYLKQVRAYTDDRPEGRGPSGTAFRTDRSFVCNDMQNDPTTAPWRDEIHKRDFHACAAFPIRFQGKVAAVLTVYSGETGFFKDREIALLEEAAHDISFALDNIAREDERRRSAAIALVSGQESLELRDAFDQHAVVSITDPQGRITFANDKFCEISGYSREELLGKDHHILNSGHHSRAYIRDLWTTIKRGDVWHGELKNKTKEGAYYWLDTTIVPFLNPDGTPRQYMAIRAIITEQREAVEALEVTEERIRFAMESANVGIWDADYATGIIQWSNVFEAQYGVAPGAFGSDFESLIARTHPDDRASLRDTIATAMKTGADFAVESRSVWPDGTIRILSSAGRIVLDFLGKPVRGIGISLDITERRSLEAQFQQAQKMEAVGRLAGGVAHDFNNLLTVILGFCELLQADLDANDPHRQDVAEIHRAGVTAAALTRQLLAFSRKQIIEPTLLDLNEVIAAMRPMLGRLIGEDVAVRVDLRPGLGIVRADRAQLEQVIMNLSVNARDAMPKGGTLTIEAADVELDEDYARSHLGVKPGAYVMLTVSDTGSGMTPDVQARLFEPFFTTKEVGKGTGLGLATIHGIVARNGGSVHVYSELGVGTTFKVYFPRTITPERAADTPALIMQTHRGTPTVLLVEDEDGLRELARRMLERHGYRVLAAANADHAIRLFDVDDSIDILLTDVVMPGASGPELAARLVAQRPALKVIYMSGYTDDAIVQHGVLNPGIALLNKPFTSAALARKVRDALA
ncbi:MAG: PAS domain S-box protein [bacterium]